MQSPKTAPRQLGMFGSDVGVIVLGPANSPIASNREAVRLLAFPHDPDQIHNTEAFLRQKINSGLMLSNGVASGTPAFVTEIRSGRRRYMCTALPIDTSNAHASQI